MPEQTTTAKRVILRDPVTGEQLIPVSTPIDNIDADSLGGKPASDYVTDDELSIALNEYVTNKVYPVSDFSDNKTITLSGNNTIIETGPDYTIETTFISETQIVQTLTYGDKQYTKYIDFTEDTIAETISVTDMRGEETT